MSEAKFSIGQIVQHQLFNYRGVIIDVDYNYLVLARKSHFLKIHYYI